MYTRRLRIQLPLYQLLYKEEKKKSSQKMTSFVNYSDQVYFYLPQTLSARRPLERDKWLTEKRSAIGDASVFPPEALPTLTANEHTLAQRCSARINNPIIASPTFEEKRKKKVLTGCQLKITRLISSASLPNPSRIQVKLAWIIFGLVVAQHEALGDVWWRHRSQ